MIKFEYPVILIIGLKVQKGNILIFDVAFLKLKTHWPIFEKKLF